MAWALALATLTGAPAAWAHGDGTPKHGGIVQTANDLSFELVTEADGATLYIEDHDKPLATDGFTGKLSVLKDGVKSEAALKATAPNMLVARGIKLGAGNKVVAVITTPQKQTLAVRFTLR
ncbi:hypothetical protein CDN99_25195 [Roseateles aquatilis]|uniref:DUF5666 domain-containing protein n=2 Tax=Roseateles aquatilis TaxID=431061 RepID=A0A246IUG6_9BURK|nr:hypothetical protein CDN99_25195 [Roseateles aquatilis]